MIPGHRWRYRTASLSLLRGGILLLCTLASQPAVAVSSAFAPYLQQAIRLAEQAPEQAIALLHTHRPASDTDRSLWQRTLGQLYSRTGDYQQAASLLIAAADSGHLPPAQQGATLQLLGEVQLRQQRYHQAQQRFEQALARCQRDCQPLRLGLGYATYYLGDYRAALNWVTPLLATEPAALPLALNSYQQLEQWSEAIKLQLRLLDRAPETLGHWRNLAFLYSRHQQPQAAAGTLLLAQQAGALTTPADWLWLANLLARSGAPGYALWVIDQASARQLLPEEPALMQTRLAYARLAGDHHRLAALYRERYAATGREQDKRALLAALRIADPEAALALLADWPSKQKTPQLWLTQLDLLAQAGNWKEAGRIARLAAADPAATTQVQSWWQFIQQRQAMLSSDTHP